MNDALAAALLNGDNNDPWTFRVGTVTNTSPIEVNIAGQDGLSANYLGSYTPDVDEIVLILQNSAELVILGRLVSGG